MTCFQFNKLCQPTSNFTNTSVCSEFYLGISLNERGNIAIWNLLKQLDEPTILIGHHRIVSALALSNHPDHNYLCSCSTDNIILWNLLQNEGKPYRGKVLLSNIEKPSNCCFNNDNSTIAVCSSSDVFLLHLKENTCSILIEQGSMLCFCLYAWDSLMLTTDENCILKAWDLQTKEVLHQKRISAGFLNVLCTEMKSKIVAVGTTSGTLYVYGEKLNTIREVQIWRILKHYFNQENCDEEMKTEFDSDCSFPVQAMHLFSIEESSQELHSFLPEVLYVLIVTSSCLFIWNINIETVDFFLDFKDESVKIGSNLGLGLIRSASISIAADNSFAFVALKSLSESIFMLKIHLEVALSKCKNSGMMSNSVGVYEEDFSKCGKNFNLTFLYSGSQEYSNSLLNYNTTRSKNISLEKATKGKVKKKTSVSNLSLPVTFHEKIKSSGYGISNRRVLFQPQINKTSIGHSQTFNLKCFQNVLPAKPIKIDTKVNSDGFLNPDRLEFIFQVNFRSNPSVTCLQIAADGNHASCTSTEGVVDIIKVGKNGMKFRNTFNGHKGIVYSAKWSHSEKMIVSASSDRTVKLWNLESLRQEPILTLGCNSSEKSLEFVAKNNFCFESAVESAQFFYLDKFILTSSGNELHLFDYIINARKTDLKRYANNSQHKLVTKIAIYSKRITAITAANQFHSNLVLCGGSSKSIDTFDMTTGQLAWHAEDIGTKPAHIIAINEGSPSMNQAASLYDLFMTAALFDGIKIWDIRTKRSVMCYKEHRSRSIPCGADFSSCGKYIASGSEDKSVYIYDLRMTSCLHKLTDPQSDVVASVAFSPSKKQLLSSSLNGTVYLYGEKEIT